MTKLSRELLPFKDIYKQMLQRCYNKKNKSYKYYGEKGIKVCDRWLGPEGKMHLAEDMGPRLNGMTIDRIDNDKDYGPGNCRWASRTEQARNRNHPSNIYVIIDGKRMCLTEAAEYIGINRETVKTRIRRGMRPLDAVLTPLLRK